MALRCPAGLANAFAVVRAVMVFCSTILGAIAHADSTLGIEQHGRAQLTFDATRLPERDLRTAAHGRHHDTLGVDLRWQLAAEQDAWRLTSDLQLLADYGHDAEQRGDGDSDAPRGLDLARVIDRTGQRRIRARLDRLHLDYQGDTVAASIGRQALSFGNGLVFAPMDFLTPFSPTATDRDFKSGDDLVSLRWRLPNERDLQLAYVLRRTDDDRLTARAGSVAVRLQWPVGIAEYGLLAARHGGDEVLGLSASLPLGEAIARADWVASRLPDGEVIHSFVVNVDRSAVLADRNVYGFVELYRNGFGRADTPRNLAAIAAPLRSRLQRGEIFTTARWYAATGATIEWHSLATQQLLLIANLGDGSFTAQSNIRIEPDDRQRMDLTASWQRGARGDEFGGIPIAPPETQTATLGGGWRLGLRYAFYW